MKIAILGGGFTGLTAAYFLSKKGHTVTLFEKENVMGGLASGFKQKGWDWYLERAYHHLFSNDSDILNFAEEAGFNKIIFNKPETASLYRVKDNYRIFPVDTPQDFLNFPLLSFVDKFRAGAVVSFLKLSPFLKIYEQMTVEEFIKSTMGKKTWEVFLEELMRKKFGNYAVNILASFIWARFNKRTSKLAYIEGGFQTFIDYLGQKEEALGIEIKKNTSVENIEKKGELFIITGIGESRRFKAEFDAVISTLPTFVMTKITKNLFSQSYIEGFKKLKYLHAVNLILESKDSVLKKSYWLNICTKDIPIMVVVQHTNFIDKKHYGNNHLLYLAKYVDSNDPLIKMTDKEIYDYWTPYLKEINPNYLLAVANYFVFKAPFAQPIFDKDFLMNKPNFETPVKNFFVANLDMTYPYDRGTNYAVKLGKEVIELITNL